MFLLYQRRAINYILLQKKMLNSFNVIVYGCSYMSAQVKRVGEKK